MKNFVGIDLGTTNSAICSFDGQDTRIWKSPEQNDVTPSAIYIDRRGNKFVGKRAYDQAPYNPDRSALLFKRLMGTSTPIELSAANLTLTPEDCSAEVLKTMYGYLPEELRTNEDTGTVITVPAAFNQMQKDATMQAAQKAGLGKVALMQEPVAAVMSVMRYSKKDGMFLIFDLGGGTLDIAIAESMAGRVSLLSHGGIQMCGGRDFDRALLDSVVRPWMRDNFDLPEDFVVDPDYKSFMRLAAWATEKAKIELSAKESAVISLSESEARIRDLSGEDMYLDITVDRDRYDDLIADRVDEAIQAARETLQKAGLSTSDLERIVFVGGPTNYKPLRDKVCFELGLPGSTDVNPMTAVAEGASIFAESIDWSKDDRSRKSTRGSVVVLGKLDLSFNYIARTPDNKAKIAVKLNSPVAAGTEFEINSPDTGWTSGRMILKNGAITSVSLPHQGEHRFKVSVYDESGRSMSIPENTIVITRTAATVDAIPASHSIAVEVVGKLGGASELDFLVRSGDTLPKKGHKIFKAAESLRAGSNKSLNIKLWEGEITSPVTDNRAIGVLKISGSDFDDGLIPAGADLECDYEITDSGNIVLEVAVPCIGSVFKSDRNFYSRQEGQIDYTKARKEISNEVDATLERLDSICNQIDDQRLEESRRKLQQFQQKDQDEVQAEDLQEAQEQVLEAKRVMDKSRKEHLKELRQAELDQLEAMYHEQLEDSLSANEQNKIERMIDMVQQSLDRNDSEFEARLEALDLVIRKKMWDQEWFVIGMFNHLKMDALGCSDPMTAMSLVNRGEKYLASQRIDELRNVCIELIRLLHKGREQLNMTEVANIMRG